MTLGQYLRGIRVFDTIGIDYNDINKMVYGRFNPDARWNGAPNAPMYESRYGRGFWRKKGNLVGERFSAEVLDEFMKTRGLTPTNSYQDREDAIVTTRDRVRSVWDTIILPAVNNPSVPEPPAPPAPIPPKEEPTVDFEEIRKILMTIRSNADSIEHELAGTLETIRELTLVIDSLLPNQGVKSGS
jgi:hypothetical protein